MRGRTHGILLVAIGAIVAPGCESDQVSDRGSETHWLTSCDSDEVCGGLKCICGACTLPCMQSSDCLGLAASAACAPPDVVTMLCPGSTHTSSLCLAVCDIQGSCSGGATCIEGVCSTRPPVSTDGGVSDGGTGAMTSGGRGSGGHLDAGTDAMTSGGAGSGGHADSGTDAMTSGGAGSGGTGNGGARALDASVDAGNDSSIFDSGADVTLPHCPGRFADGDTWDKTYGFGPLVPLVVGPKGRLVSGFYRGYAFSDDEGQTWSVKDLSVLIPAEKAWPYPAVSADGASVWLFLRGHGTLVSRNAGKSFAVVTALSSLSSFDPGLSSFDSGRVVVSPYHDQHLLAYAAHQDVTASLAGSLYRSIDGGKTWVNLDSAIAAAGANGTNGVTFDPSTPNHFWVADMPEGVLETTDGGGAFAKVPGSTHSFLSTVARTSDGTSSRLVVTGACSAPTTSVIGQNSWQSSTGDNPSCCPWPIALPDPFDLTSTVLQQCHDTDPANLRYSTNGGVSFNLAQWPTSLDVSSFHVQSVHVDPFHRRTFYAVHPNAMTLLKSTDGGANWTAVGWLPGHGC